MNPLAYFLLGLVIGAIAGSVTTLAFVAAHQGGANGRGVQDQSVDRLREKLTVSRGGAK